MNGGKYSIIDVKVIFYMKKKNWLPISLLILKSIPSRSRI